MSNSPRDFDISLDHYNRIQAERRELERIRISENLARRNAGAEPDAGELRPIDRAISALNGLYDDATTPVILDEDIPAAVPVEEIDDGPFINLGNPPELTATTTLNDINWDSVRNTIYARGFSPGTVEVPIAPASRLSFNDQAEEFVEQFKEYCNTIVSEYPVISSYIPHWEFLNAISSQPFKNNFIVRIATYLETFSGRYTIGEMLAGSIKNSISSYYNEYILHEASSVNIRNDLSSDRISIRDHILREEISKIREFFDAPVNVEQRRAIIGSLSDLYFCGGMNNLASRYQSLAIPIELRLDFYRTFYNSLFLGETKSFAEMIVDQEFLNDYKRAGYSYLFNAINRASNYNYLWSETLEYIQMLANDSREDISSWDILKIFLNDDKTGFVVDRREVNKRFFRPRADFEYLTEESYQQAVAEADKKQNPINIDEIFKGGHDALLDKKRSNLDELEKQYHAQYTEFIKTKDTLVRENKIYSLLSARTSEEQQKTDLANAIDSINKSGYFQVISYNKKDHSLQFRNTKNYKIKVDHKVYKAETDIAEVDLGIFDHHLFLDNLNCKMHPVGGFKERRFSTDHNGPFIHNQGQLCFGSEVTRLDQNRKTMNIAEHVRLIYDIVSQYSEQAIPYQKLIYFINDQRRINLYKNSALYSEYRKTKTVTQAMIGECKQIHGVIKFDFDRSNRIGGAPKSRLIFDFVKDQFVRYGREPIPACVGCKNEVLKCSC